VRREPYYLLPVWVHSQPLVFNTMGAIISLA
jgi:hypothetical protein